MVFLVFNISKIVRVAMFFFCDNDKVFRLPVKFLEMFFTRLSTLIKNRFQELQIGILNHPVTDKITTVKVLNCHT